MKKHTAMLLSIAVIIISAFSLCMTSCKKKSNGTGVDSGVFYFHLHTQIFDSTIGGNTDGLDSNTTGSANPWYLDSLGRRIELFVPQFFISNVTLVNANGTTLTLDHVSILKGLDSEDYYLYKVPIGTYTAVTFAIGLTSADSAMPYSTFFLTNGFLYPYESTMWSGTDYYGMKITGAYDTTAGHTGINPIPFSFEIPNGLTIQHPVSLPIRNGTTYPLYVLTSGGTQYIHVLCDYGKLLSAINLRTSNQTSVNPLIADSLANGISNMFRYEQ